MSAASTSKKSEAPRRLCARQLAVWIESGRTPDRAPEGGRAAAAQEILLGVIRRRETLDWWISRCAPRLPSPSVRAVLWVALYEWMYMSDSPAHAVLDEAAESARALAGEGTVRFVNAVLRRCQREEAEWRSALESAPPWVRGSHPEFLWKRWAARFGEESANRLCDWDNQPACVAVRIRSPETQRAHWREEWKRAGVDAEPHPADPDHFLRLPRGVSPARLPGFEEGAWYVQDPSTARAPDLLAARPGERILDACAAPGGKTFILAEAMQGHGRLIALDASRERLRQLQQNLVRMRQTWIAIQALDARTLPPSKDWMDFDGILLDVPCSNTGVLQRRPAARWRFDAGSLTALAYTQRDLLHGCAARLRIGGRLVYSTCSLEPEENEHQVRDFLKNKPAFELESEIRTHPLENGCDGSYAARIVRKRA